jgi:hypothetical protein
MEGMRNAYYKNVVQKPDEKGQPERPRHRLKDNIKMDIKETGYGFYSFCQGMSLILEFVVS